MKKFILFILLFSIFSINNIFSQEELPCENAIDYGVVNDPAKTGSIEDGEGAWYFITVTETLENVVFSTCDAYTDFDTDIAIFSGCEEEMNLLWEGDDECDYGRDKILVTSLESGTYYVYIYSYSGYGNYSLNISQITSETNTCETAVDYGIVNGDSLSGAIFPGDEYWFSINIPEDMQNVAFSLVGTIEFDTEMEIYRNCDDEEFWKYNDDAISYPMTLASEVFVEDLPAGNYYIKVSGLDEYQYGNFTFKITDEFPEGVCITAVDYGNMNGPFVIRQSMADELFWYKITTTENYSNVLFSTCDATDIDCEIVIIESCDFNEFEDMIWEGERINCTYPEIFIPEFNAGTYYIGIFTWDSEESGQVSLKISSDNNVIPQVLVLEPGEGTQEVSIGSDVYVEFDIPVIENDLRQVKIIYGGQEVTGVYANISEVNNKIIYIGHDDFLPDTEYTVIVPSGSITNVNEEIRWSFKTARNIKVDENLLNKTSVYPNPSTGVVNVEVSGPSVLKLINITGEILETYSINNNLVLNVKRSSGVYYLIIESDNGKEVHKLIIQ